MRVKQSKSKNTINYAIIKDIKVGNKQTSTIVENLGNHKTLLKEHPEMEPLEWARLRAKELTEQEQEENHELLLTLSQTKQIQSNRLNEAHGGYLFLQALYHQLDLPRICREIQKRHHFHFSLDKILSRLIYGRILSPASKRSTLEFSKTLLEPKEFELQHFYRALEVISQETDFIQEQVYQTSKRTEKRQTDVFYYDCTNFYFEIEAEDEEGLLRQYGPSKEHRPNPIVEMGLFMDTEGIPLAFCIHPGNTNEQTTLKPLERKIVKDFKASQFVVCTDAGLSSKNNKVYNSFGERSFVTTQSIKKLKKEYKDWALDKSGWRKVGEEKSIFYNLAEIEASDELSKHIFFKESPFPDQDLPEQRLIVTFSVKYRDYHRSIRERQMEWAAKLVGKPSLAKKKRQTDFKRFLKETNTTREGEIAEQVLLTLNQERIQEEARYDGLYAVATNLEDEVERIIAINQGRWEIEESFRIMKQELRARPVYLSRSDRIQAHFTICFLALMMFRLLEKCLGNQFTCPELVQTLRSYKFRHLYGSGYIPIYTRTGITDQLHQTFGFQTDFEIISEKKMKKILKQTKTR